MSNIKQLDHNWIGSVSWGTMISEDIIEKCLPYLRQANHPKYTAIQDEWDFMAKDEDGRVLDDKQEQLSYLLQEDVWEAMNDIAPYGCFFGASEGDGADYGFWSYIECPGCEGFEFEETKEGLAKCVLCGQENDMDDIIRE